MAKFEIEIPDNVAALIDSADRKHRDFGQIHKAAPGVAAIAIPALSKWGSDLTYQELFAVARLFNALGHCLQQTAGWDWAFVSLGEKEKRAERARQSHVTRRERRAAGIPTDAERERVKRRGRQAPAPAFPVNVVRLADFR